MNKLLTLILCLFFFSCQMESKPDLEALKKEVEATEIAFSDYSVAHGTQAAFVAFAHENAAIKRRDTVIVGIDGIRAYYGESSLLESRLAWKPSFVDVASSGDMAYTYGRYTFWGLRPDSTEINNTGVFHTVWKKNEAGEWKFVYD